MLELVERVKTHFSGSIQTKITCSDVLSDSIAQAGQLCVDTLLVNQKILSVATVALLVMLSTFRPSC